MGLSDATTNSIINTLKEFAVTYKPYDGYTLKDHCEELYVDAGPQLNSQELMNWCVSQNIRLISAAPHHQEMNGMVERQWQSIRKMAFAMCNQAHIGWAFLHHALMYATCIHEVLPTKGCIKTYQGRPRQRCPRSLWYRDNPDDWYSRYVDAHAAKP